MAPFNLFKWVSNPTRHLKSVLVALHFAGLMCFPRTKGRHESSLLTLCRFPSVTWWIFDAVASQHACISETSAQERLHSSQQWDQSKLKRVDSLTTSKALGFFFFFHWQFCGLDYWPCCINSEDHNLYCTKELAFPCSSTFFFLCS